MTCTHEVYVQAESQEKLELLGQERDEVHYELAQLLLTALVVMTHGHAASVLLFVDLHSSVCTFGCVTYHSVGQFA